MSKTNRKDKQVARSGTWTIKKQGRNPSPPSNARIIKGGKSALDRAREALETMTDEEDAAITADALSDPDNPPADELFARRGRPKSANPKQPVSIRLDADVIDHFKSGGEGWQSRINAALRKAAKLPKAG